MKIKSWLLISYLIVMILPLVAAYFLFAWINSYNDDQKVAEYIETTGELKDLIHILKDPSLYQMESIHVKERIEKLSSEERIITLYNPFGLIIYSSDPTSSLRYGLTQEQLYNSLYDLKQGYRAFTYKEPVFVENKVIGFFEVELSRKAWVKGVSYRSVLMTSLFIAFFIALYILVIQLVNRKLNKRLAQLKEEMTAFAGGNTLQETETNNDEIGELQRHFYNMRKQINAAREIIEREQNRKEYMIASISHDLKTPLTSIKAYAESLEVAKNLTDKEKEEYRKVIIEKSDFMKQMLDDLLTYTLLQSPTYEMDLVEVDGDEFFEMLVSDYEELCVRKNIILHKQSIVTGTYKVNPKQMMRVADNLMSNAIMHTGSGNNIWIAAISEYHTIPEWLFDFVKDSFQTDSKDMYFIVQNEGKGISKDQLKNIFDPLYQADQARSKRDDHGTGLGLSITKQIIEKHNGKVKIYSQEQKGTTVICSLPKVVKKGDRCEME